MKYREFCTGCGLCKSMGLSELLEDEKGFKYPTETTKAFFSKCKEICPAGGKQCGQFDAKKIWGRSKAVYLGYSTNNNIRFHASSGGVLTSLCLYLLDNKIVDGIIQTRKDNYNPISTVTQCSVTKEDVISCCGSRYTVSSPLENISKYIGKGKKYAFIGKPCDIIALRNYANLNPEVNTSIIIMLSFFCAGIPSKAANISLLQKLKCNKDSCISLTYRGDGWPGYTTAQKEDGSISKLTYQEAWRDTLGRDVRKICRFCLDGIGELADISCGDAWYLNKIKKPIFEENQGRNVIFARTDIGKQILLDAEKKGYLYLKNYENYEEELKHSQAYQYERRQSLTTILSAMKITGRSIPDYNWKLLKAYAQDYGINKKLRRFVGTIKRIYNGSI